MIRLGIGRAVRVNAVASCGYEDLNIRSVHRTPCQPWDGVIVGVRKRQEGVRRGGGGYKSILSLEPDEYGVYLEVKKTVTLYLVAYGLSNLPKEVHPDDLTPLEEGVPRLCESLPWFARNPVICVEGEQTELLPKTDDFKHALTGDC